MAASAAMSLTLRALVVVRAGAGDQRLQRLLVGEVARLGGLEDLDLGVIDFISVISATPRTWMAISSIELRRWPTASDIALLTSTTRSTLAAITCACQALMAGAEQRQRHEGAEAEGESLGDGDVLAEGKMGHRGNLTGYSLVIGTAPTAT